MSYNQNMNLTAGERANESRANSSFQNAKDGPFSYYSAPLALEVFKLTLQVAIALFGVLGNILVCVVITKRANMKTSMNLYLRNLAITDLGVLLVNFPLAANSAHNTSGWPFGRFLCLYVAPATDIFFGASIWSITVIAIERYKNIISRKVFVKKVESFKRVTLKIVLIWLIAFAVVAAPLYPFFVFRSSPVSVKCYPKGPAFIFKAYAICLVIFWYLLPLAIITITYWKISNQLRQSNTFHKTMHGENTLKSKVLRDEEKQRLKQNKKALRILTPLVVIFAVTMLPLNAFRLAQVFSPEFVLYEYFYQLFSVCCVFIVINSAADPIVYYISSKEFRKGLQDLLCKGNRLSKNGARATLFGKEATTSSPVLETEM